MVPFWPNIKWRVCRALFVIPIALSIVGLAWYFFAVVTDRVPDGLSVFLAMPVMIGVLLCLAGIVWLRDNVVCYKEICPHCGYDMRAQNKSGICPECGVSKHVSSGAHHPSDTLVRSIGYLLFATGLVCIAFGILYFMAWSAGWLGGI